jgi:SseB protein C-terminal domain
VRPHPSESVARKSCFAVNQVERLTQVDDFKLIEVPATRLRFFAEQTGEIERLLTDALKELFRQKKTVVSAYLARAAVDGSPTVVLALRTLHGYDERLLREVQRTFAGIFNESQHLDILFISSDQEADLGRICRPFFISSS